MLADRQSDVEPLSPIFKAQLRVRDRKLPDQVVDWLGTLTGILARRQLREVGAITFIQNDMYRRVCDRPSLDDILTPQQSKQAHVHGRSIDVSKCRSVVGTDRAERHVFDHQREVEQVVVETLSCECDLRIRQQARDLREHVPFYGRGVQRCDKEKEEEDSTAGNHAEKAETAAAA